MEWQSLNTLREKYLSFFESKGHLRLSSFPLIPKDDNSLLLINAGMAPLKKYFTGEVTPPRKRVTTCQKCIRTPDIERVGKTARHGTYFEMLGNFSFGDYFKHEATAWAWEFCTKVLEMPVDKLWVTIYQDDDEAFDIWTKEVGVAPERIVRMGKEDNFWELGSGPCGPCSEIYYDRGEEFGCGSPDCKVGCECDRFMEFWNLVFTQFDSDGNGNYTPLANPNIDTGMGLERLACIFQNVNNLFEVDTVQKIMTHLADISGYKYKEDDKIDVSLRVITDHIRSTTFMIGDGVMPSNEGRGYVLRRLLRRAARHGRLLGINKPFLHELCSTVIEENKSAYPELVEKVEYIKTVILVEEENFGKTIDKGLNMLNELIVGDIKELSGKDAFKLYDTYGFPLDLTKDILLEKGISVNEDEFNALMSEQKQRARDARNSSNIEGWKDSNDFLDGIDATNFVGYETDSVNAKVLAVNKTNIVLDTTSFYAESGGQVADTGEIFFEGGSFKVENVSKTPSGIFVHEGHFVNGNVKVGDLVNTFIDAKRRENIKRNHTAAHLLQAALRKVLGNHVEQAGQYVSEGSVRFDFTHFSAVSKKELDEVEKIVNTEILKGLKVTTEEMSIEAAKSKGAMALFGEKYGDTVRVVTAGDISIELCGGTHVNNTSEICLFKIVSENSVASGVRRIEAVTGEGILKLINNYKNIIFDAADALKLQNAFELPQKAKQITEDLKAAEKKISALEGKIAANSTDEFIKNAKDHNGFKVITAELSNVAPNIARNMCDAIKDKEQNAVIVFALNNDGKLTFLASCGKSAVSNGAHAGNIVRAVATVAGGNGGGKPDSAMAGGKDIEKAVEALQETFKVL